MVKGLGSYENPQRYFRAKVPFLSGQETLVQALESVFTNRKGVTNRNLVNALAERQAKEFYASARQRELGSREALAQALADYYGNKELADKAVASGEFKPRKRVFKVRKKRGEGYLKRRMGVLAFARRNAEKLKDESKTLWITTRNEIKVVSSRQAAAYRRQSKRTLL